MVCRYWIIASFILTAAAAAQTPSRSYLRVRAPKSYFKEDGNAAQDDGTSTPSMHSDETEGPDPDDGPDGVGDGNGIDWTNWSWPDDLTPDVWGDAIGPFGQCGGIGYKGNETCVQDWTCVQLAEAFSECLPMGAVTDVNSTTVIVIPTKAPPTEVPNSGSSSRGISSSTTDQPDTEVPNTNVPDTPGTDNPRADSPATDTPTQDPPATTNNPVDASQFKNVLAWQQCGGRSFNYSRYASGPFPHGDVTKLTCTREYQCDVVNDWFFQCVPVHDRKSAALWSQCGGEYHQGLTNCVAGSNCKYFNQWYSQCIPN